MEIRLAGAGDHRLATGGKLAFPRDALEGLVLVLDAILKIVAIGRQKPYDLEHVARSRPHDIAGRELDRFTYAELVQFQTPLCFDAPPRSALIAASTGGRVP